MKDYDAKESWIKQFSYEGLLRAKWIGTRFESILQGFKVVQEYLICFMSLTFLKMEISCWGINAELWFLMIQEMEHLRIYCSPECLFGLKLVFTREPELD